MADEVCPGCGGTGGVDSGGNEPWGWAIIIPCPYCGPNSETSMDVYDDQELFAVDTPLTRFYIHGRKNPQGRTIEDLIAFSDGALEASHDVVQWMFPLHEPSNFNDEAPLIAKEGDYDERALLMENPVAQDRMRRAAIRFGSFLGFGYDEERGFYPGEHFSKNAKNWRTQYNHNFLRITRVIRSLRLFGQEELAKQFHDVVRQAGIDNGSASERTCRFWRLALEDDVYETLRK